MKGCSETVAVKIDEEVARFIHESYERARKILEEHRGEVEKVVTALLKYEVLYDEDVDIILTGGEITRELPANGVAAAAEAPEKKEKDAAGASPEERTVG
jgi:hypothetical protein